MNNDDFTEVPPEAEPVTPRRGAPPQGQANDATGQLTYGADDAGAFAHFLESPVFEQPFAVEFVLRRVRLNRRLRQ